MLWAVYCTDKPNTAEARDRHLKAHRAYLDEVDSKIFFSGPLQSDDATRNIGSLFILNVKGREEAEAFINSEPFNNAGIFETIIISRMRKGRFHPALADSV